METRKTVKLDHLIIYIETNGTIIHEHEDYIMDGCTMGHKKSIK